LKILVVGDYIEDRYIFGKATRLCPEAPVPVIVPLSKEDSRAGGAGLVAVQLESCRISHIVAWYGSYSTKKRMYAGDHLICRVDEDSHTGAIIPWDDGFLRWADAIVVSDYGKGAMTPELARKIVATGKPCFVDAKHHWHWYEGKNVTIFPNHLEARPIASCEMAANQVVTSQVYEFGRVVSKMGKDGCRLNDAEHKDLVIPATVTEVVDVCGAGDTFMASFVYAWSLQLPAEDCLKFANAMAGESCRHLGTYVVPRQFAQAEIDRLRASKESGPQDRGSSLGSTPEDFAQWHQSNQCEAAGDEGKVDIPHEDSRLAQAMREAAKCTTPLWQTPQRSPSTPIGSPDTPLPSDQGTQNDSGKKSE
jgi:D-beta-D-heptose 7-phosphate kinase/D-beta-D-heptose 1-phosphate adenosyltransferase